MNTPSERAAPGERGWVRWDWTDERLRTTGMPRHGICSVSGCHAVSVVAVQRAAAATRPVRWQPYCAEHAVDRGVLVTAAGLAWTPQFLAARRR